MASTVPISRSSYDSRTPDEAWDVLSQMYTQARPHAASVDASVRRAMVYIDSHASLPVTVTDIVHAAGTSPYALRAAFRRGLDTMPTAYLRRVRLDSAHRELQATELGMRADVDQSVDAIVAELGERWGFARHDSFIAAYGDAFEASPTVTLRSHG